MEEKNTPDYVVVTYRASDGAFEAASKTLAGSSVVVSSSNTLTIKVPAKPEEDMTDKWVNPHDRIREAIIKRGLAQKCTYPGCEEMNTTGSKWPNGRCGAHVMMDEIDAAKELEDLEELMRKDEQEAFASWA